MIAFITVFTLFEGSLCSVASKYKDWFKLLPPQSNRSRAQSVSGTEIIIKLGTIRSQFIVWSSGFWLVCGRFEIKGYVSLLIIITLLSLHLKTFDPEVKKSAHCDIFLLKSLLWIKMFATSNIIFIQKTPNLEHWDIHLGFSPCHSHPSLYLQGFFREALKGKLSWGCLKNYTQKS